MSNYDQNTAAAGTSADHEVSVDAGLCAYMLRVYNYMAIGVGLTGLIAMLTYQLAVLRYFSPLMWVFMLAPLALVFFIGAPINMLSAEGARLLFFVYAALSDCRSLQFSSSTPNLRLRVCSSFRPQP